MAKNMITNFSALLMILLLVSNGLPKAESQCLVGEVWVPSCAGATLESCTRQCKDVYGYKVGVGTCDVDSGTGSAACYCFGSCDLQLQNPNL